MDVQTSHQKPLSYYGFGCCCASLILLFKLKMYRDNGPRGGAEHLARIHGTEEDKVSELHNQLFLLEC